MQGRSSDKPNSFAPLPAHGARMLSLATLRELGLPANERAADPPRGRVFSFEPSQGDPRLIAVLPEDASEPFLIDRNTMRPVQSPSASAASEGDLVRAADLADRVQLALGEPVQLGFAFAEDRVHVTSIERLDVRLCFTPTSYRCIAPFVGDKSTLAPLSVDALDRALRAEEDRGDEHRVRRIFGRAYRKVDAHHTPWSRGSRGRLRAVERAVRLARDVAFATSDARRYRWALAESAHAHASSDLRQLDKPDLVEALRRRMSLVVSALVLLERSRMATLGLLPVLERACAKLERDAFLALAAPLYTEERKAIDRRLLELSELCGAGSQLAGPANAPAQAEWERIKRALRHVRCLGMDVRPSAIGADDEQLQQALHEVRARYAGDPENTRSQARARIIRSGLWGSLGPAGVPLAASAVALLDRLALEKGSVAEGLSAALLRLRSAALEAGRRLADEGALEREDDTLYMSLEEIEQALEGELGAYAARARMRREDDHRWRNYEAPRLIVGREPALR